MSDSHPSRRGAASADSEPIQVDVKTMPRVLQRIVGLAFLTATAGAAARDGAGRGLRDRVLAVDGDRHWRACDAGLTLPRTVSSGFTTVVNAMQLGLLRVVVYGPLEIDGNGVLLKLHFKAVGYPGAVSPLVWEKLIFNEGEIPTTMTNGQIELSDAKSQTDLD